MTARPGPALCRVAALLAVLVLAGCGGGDEGESESGPERIKVLDTEGVPSSFLELGIRRRFFERQGLEVDLSVSRGGAAAIPAVLNGDVQVAGSNVVSVLVAHTKGLPIQIVAPGTFGTTDPDHDFAAMLVRADSDIHSVRDLRGKTVAVNTLQDVLDITDKAWFEKEGVEPSGVRFIEVEHPEMQIALERGRVDAITTIEPFVTKAAGAGSRILGYPYYNARPGLQIGSYVASKQYIESHPDVIERFAAGVASTATYVARHPEDLRKLLVSTADMEPRLAEELTLPVWKPEPDREALAALGELMKRYGAVDRRPDVSQAVAVEER